MAKFNVDVITNFDTYARIKHPCNICGFCHEDDKNDKHLALCPNLVTIGESPTYNDTVPH